MTGALLVWLHGLGWQSHNPLTWNTRVIEGAACASGPLCPRLFRMAR